MSLTFGTVIADMHLQSSGLKSLITGIALSILFGFIFGLILGAAKIPWGNSDWPTEEMKGRYGLQVSEKLIIHVFLNVSEKKIEYADFYECTEYNILADSLIRIQRIVYDQKRCFFSLNE